MNLNGALLKHFPNSVYVINQIAHALQTGARWGMHSMAQDLQRLAAAGLIDAAQAQSHLGPNHPGP